MAKITKKQAEALWSELREAFLNTEVKLKEIIDARAWEPLGYPKGSRGFVQAYSDFMAGVRLATDVAKAHVVYQMFDAGMANEDVSEAAGVGAGAVDLLRDEWVDGVSPDMARVRAHLRGRPSEPRHVNIELTSDEYQLFRDIASRRNLNLAHEAAKAVRAHFGKLA